MADVSRDRGQLILVTGLILAVAMVGLVLVLNTAIYTENVASRGADQSPREAIEYRATVVSAVGGVIEEENAQEYGSHAAVDTEVRAGIDTIDNFTARSYASGGTVVRINQSASSLAVTEGNLVRQTTARPFQNASGALDDWELATGLEDDEVRAFTVNVSRASLESDVDNAFTVRLNDGSDTWRTFVYDDGGSVTIAVSIDGGPKTDVCSVAASEATIDLTRGTIDGERCAGLEWAEGLSSTYALGYRNGENATGTYDLTLEDAGVVIDADNVDPGPSNAVYRVPAVYSVEFEISYETSTLLYVSAVRVAPGEPG